MVTNMIPATKSFLKLILSLFRADSAHQCLIPVHIGEKLKFSV